MAAHEVDRCIDIAGRVGVIGRLDDQAGLAAPAARTPVKRRNVVGLRPLELVPEELREELVVAVPVALRIERDEKQVRALELIKDPV